MAWSNTDTGIKYSPKAATTASDLTVPSNFSATANVKDVEIAQWRIAKECAKMLIESKVIGGGKETSKYTVTLSGTATAGGAANDTVTVTVTLHTA